MSCLMPYGDGRGAAGAGVASVAPLAEGVRGAGDTGEPAGWPNVGDSGGGTGAPGVAAAPGWTGGRPRFSLNSGLAKGGEAGAGTAFVAGPLPVVRAGNAGTVPAAPITCPKTFVIGVKPNPCWKTVTVVASGVPKAGPGNTGMFIVPASSACTLRPSVPAKPLLLPAPRDGINALADRRESSDRTVTTV